MVGKRRRVCRTAERPQNRVSAVENTVRRAKTLTCKQNGFHSIVRSHPNLKWTRVLAGIVLPGQEAASL